MPSGSVVRKSYTAQVLDRIRRGEIAGLKAGAQVFKNEVKRRLRGGYTSGDFVTGRVLNSVVSTEPTFDAAGTGTIMVGTDLLRMAESTASVEKRANKSGRFRLDYFNPYYPLYWELGHFNIFTRKYERVEVWRPAFEASRQQALDAYVRVFQRTVGNNDIGVGFAPEVIDL